MDGNRVYNAWGGNTDTTRLDFKAVGPHIKVGDLVEAEFTEAGVILKLVIADDVFAAAATIAADPECQIRGNELLVSEYVVDRENRVVDEEFVSLPEDAASNEDEDDDDPSAAERAQWTTSTSGRRRRVQDWAEVRRRGDV